ncbi:MAG: hypothetical protein M3299_01210 [Thermoproteota archaeon]|nr:hypothetical protein [Thermoproteota archaeon]
MSITAVGLFAVLMALAISVDSPPSVPSLHYTSAEMSEEKQVLDIQYYEDGSMLVLLSDGTKAHGSHTFTPERGFLFENATTYMSSGGGELIQ